MLIGDKIIPNNDTAFYLKSYWLLKAISDLVDLKWAKRQIHRIYN